MSFTPMIRQYLDVKKQHPDAILFFRLGDFYEMFFEDAVLASRELEITLTGRDGGGSERVPMCGVPYHASDGYIARLIAKGHRVAVCEQVEDPATAKGIVRREVTRVITPGTVIDNHLLEDKSNNFLLSVFAGHSGAGLAFTDVTTGLFMVTVFALDSWPDDLLNEIVRLRPAEIIIPSSQIKSQLISKIKESCRAPVNGYFDSAFLPEAAADLLNKQFGKDALKECETFSYNLAAAAAGALLSFLRDTQKRELSHINRLEVYSAGLYMLIDAATVNNLELTGSLRENNSRWTVLTILDRTLTAMGGRLLRAWLLQPLMDVNRIVERHDAVQELVESVYFRRDLRENLKNIYDLERLAGKISFGTANARDLVALRKSIEYLPVIKSLLEKSSSIFLKRLGREIESLSEIKDLLYNAIADDPPLSVRDGGLIKTGYHQEVDRLRSAGKNGKKLLADMEEKERSRTGIRSLKIGYNRVFGYYIEITRANLALAPHDYQRRQTLANAERFITPELKEYEEMILGAEERLVQLEYHIFLDLRENILARIHSIQRTARALAGADVVASLAELAVSEKYCRPEVNPNRRISVREGRHPVLEQVLGPGRFVPNDLDFDGENSRMVILTGPNMAGKSTFMRQVALIALMAQMGSYVPAKKAEIGLIDRIFVRAGAVDDLAGGQSTFMVEMNECREILLGASSRSLVIMDEVGRGTSTYDGISIARALAEYINEKIRSRTLFSTHYHELTDMEQITGIVNYTVAVKEEGDDIVFLRKVVPGKADRSYGIHVARLAGLPEEVLSRSRDVLASLEIVKKPCVESAAAREEKVRTTVPNAAHHLLQELRLLDIACMTPLEALNILDNLQKRINGAFYNEGGE